MDPRIDRLAMARTIADGDRFELITFPDDEIRLRVTDGDVQVVEYESRDREGPPPHTHPWHEIEYVIDGTAEFYLDGEWTRGGPGTVQMLPAGAAHSVRIPEGAARLLMVTMGAPYDGFARDMAALYTDGPTQEKIVAVAAEHGVALG
jgi:quercetin dioxygenase-like cupin family protein